MIVTWRRLQRIVTGFRFSRRCLDDARSCQQTLKCLLTRSAKFSLSPIKGYSTQTESKYSQSVIDHVKEILERHSELSRQITSNEASRLSHGEIRRISKLVAGMTPVVKAAKKLELKQEELKELELMGQEDSELGELANQEKRICQQNIQDIQDEILKSLIPKDQDDESSAVIEVRAGTGGLEASFFAEEIFHMYQKYSSYKGWKFEALNISPSHDKGGYKSATACITGSGVYREIKHESGVHRVQRVPTTDSAGRIHTSTISVVVLPQPGKVDITINQSDLKIETFRASGAGGQHVNTTNSAVRITHLPTKVVVTCQEGRSQYANKEKALKVLKAQLYDTQKEQLSTERSTARNQQIGSAERSEKIRTYHYQQGRITDHRIGVSMHGIAEFLEGESKLEDLIAQLKTFHETQALERLLSGDISRS